MGDNTMDTNHQYTSEYPTLHEVQSYETHNVAILYGSSTRNEWKALSLQTNMTIRRRERITGITTLSDQDDLAFGMLQSDGHEETAGTTPDPSKDLLRIEDGTEETLVEWSLGVDPDDVYVGVQNPSTENISGLQGDRERRETGSSDLDSHGVLSQHTQTANGHPTTALSTKPNQGIVRIDSDDEGRNPIRVGFYNDSGADATVDVTAVGVAYHVTPIQTQSVTRDIVFGNGFNRRVLTWGSFQNTSPNLPAEWGDGVVTLTNEDVQSVLSSNGA